jgi:hypothetical protein
MADQPIDCTESMFRAANCAGCGTNVVAAVDYDGEPMCLECRRRGEGIDWESQDLIGEWHPAIGYPRPMVWLDPREPRLASGWRWACINCFMNGPADNARHAAHLIRMHDTFACPALPTTPEEHALRVARRVDLTRRYPEQAPAWMETKRPAPLA